jgi:hypothetical protein
MSYSTAEETDYERGDVENSLVEASKSLLENLISVKSCTTKYKAKKIGVCSLKH